MAVTSITTCTSGNNDAGSRAVMFPNRSDSADLPFGEVRRIGPSSSRYAPSPSCIGPRPRVCSVSFVHWAPATGMVRLLFGGARRAPRGACSGAAARRTEQHFSTGRAGPYHECGERVSRGPLIARFYLTGTAIVIRL